MCVCNEDAGFDDGRSFWSTGVDLLRSGCSLFSLRDFQTRYAAKSAASSILTSVRVVRTDADETSDRCTPSRVPHFSSSFTQIFVQTSHCRKGEDLQGRQNNREEDLSNAHCCLQLHGVTQHQPTCNVSSTISLLSFNHLQQAQNAIHPRSLLADNYLRARPTFTMAIKHILSALSISCLSLIMSIAFLVTATNNTTATRYIYLSWVTISAALVWAFCCSGLVLCLRERKMQNELEKGVEWMRPKATIRMYSSRCVIAGDLMVRFP